MNTVARSVFGVLLFFAFQTASLFGDWSETANIRPSWSGAWYEADQPGHGISVEVLDDERTIFYWYTYDLDGNPIWLLAQGVNEPYLFEIFPIVQVEATAYYHDGMIFGEFEPATGNQQEWGTIILEFPYWECDRARMEWHPTMEGFTQGAVWFERLTSLSGLDCVDHQDQDIAGNWEVQFGYDAERTYPVEIVAAPDPENPDQPDLLSFEFLDESDCPWSGEIEGGVLATYVFSADWSNQCGGAAVEHSGSGTLYFEYKLCNSDNECTRKNEVMIFEDEGEYLIFSR